MSDTPTMAEARKPHRAAMEAANDRLADAYLRAANAELLVFEALEEAREAGLRFDPPVDEEQARDAEEAWGYAVDRASDAAAYLIKNFCRFRPGVHEDTAYELARGL